jgi:hypothetical protein
MKTLRPQDHLRPLDESLLADLLQSGVADGTFVSIYLPTHRAGSDTRENPIRFKSLLKSVRSEVADGGADLEAILGRLEKLEAEHDFWQHQTDGLAVFADKDRLDLVRLPRSVAEKASVADSFHVKPLTRLLQSAGRYQLLAVTQKSVRLFEGDLDGIAEVPLHADVPTGVIDALGGQVSGDLNVNSYGGLSYSGMFHGHHDNKDDRDKDLERFLRAVDRAIYEYHGRGGALPLYFAGDVDYHDRFFKASHHPRVVKQGVRINPDAPEVDHDRLREEMAGIIRPAFDKEVADALEQFGTAKAQQQGSDDLEKVAKAAVGGRIATLVVDADQSIGGRINRETGEIRRLKESGPDVDDLLDDLAELTLRTGGRVLSIPGERHPSSDGVAAIYRF